MVKKTRGSKSMKKNRRWGILASVFLLCLAVGLAWKSGLINTHQVSASPGTKNGGHKQLEKKNRTVGVVHPSLVTDGVVITLPGRARASQKATLFFRVSGPLVEIHANPGDQVKKGTLLLELDARDYQRQVKVMESKLTSAQANLAKMKKGARPEDIRIIESSLSAARADLALAVKELERYDILYKNQAVTEQAYDRAKTSVQSLSAKAASMEQQLLRGKSGARKEDITAARAGIAELTVRLEIARDQLNDTRLLAPFDGVVTRRIPENHEMVAQGQPVMTLDDISHLDIPVAVPENQVGLFMDRNPDILYKAMFLTSKNREFPARLSEFSSRADHATGTYEFVFTIVPGPNDVIFPGMTAEIKVLTGSSSSKSKSLAIPLQSLLGVAGNSAHVFIVDPITRTALRQPITFEALAGSTQVMVTKGLAKNDLVVSQGSAFIRQGEALTFEKVQGAK
jgi:membrane fusion protein, multidrug efflux system